MTIFFDSEIDKIFKRMSNSFFQTDDIFEGLREGSESGSYCYGYTMTIGPDGRPVVKKYSSAQPDLPQTLNARESIVDTIVDQKEKTVKLIVELLGIKKTDIKILVEGNKTVDISAQRDNKKYHASVPLNHKVIEDSAKASYKNGILQLAFKLVEEKPTSKKVEVE